MANRVFIILLITLVTVGCDQATKELAINNLKGMPSTEYLGGIFKLVYAENPGAFLSLGAGLSKELRFVIFSLLSGLGLVALAVYLLKSRIDTISTLSASFILGGGIGNLIDRLFRDSGRVIDFMNMGVGGLRTGIFNIADIAIMGGTIVLLIMMFIYPDPPKNKLAKGKVVKS